MSRIWGGSPAARDPMSAHYSPDDFVDTHHDGDVGMHDRDGPVDPNVSISKHDGRPLYGGVSSPHSGSPYPGSLAQGRSPHSGSPMSPLHAGPSSPGQGQSPHSVHSPYMESVSRLDGRPLGPSSPAPAPGSRPMSPVNYTHYPSPMRHVGHHDETIAQDCYGAGRSFMDHMRAIFYGDRRPTEGVCFVDETFVQATEMPPPQPDPQWTFVGAGAGAYDDSFQYKYVGEGPDFHTKHTTSHRYRLRKCCVYLGIIFLVSTAIVTIFWLLAFSQKPFDCSSDVDDEVSGWSFKKKAWCCDNEDKGCSLDSAGFLPDRVEEVMSPTVTSTSTTSTWAFRCDAELAQAESHSWTPGHIAYCCLKAGVGCPRTTTQLPFDCEAGFRNWARDWSKEKKAWCCSHQYVGCPGQIPGITPPRHPGPYPLPPQGTQHYDCDAGWGNWEAGWSRPKKAWCCQYYGKACPFVPTSTTVTTTKYVEPFDCWAGWSKWEAGWSLAKKVFCCKAHGKGCPDRPSTTPAVNHGCDTKCNYKDHTSSCRSRVKWLVDNENLDCDKAFGKVRWECPVCDVCQPHDTGCTTKPEHDCRSGWGNFLHDWSVKHRSYCCKAEQKACAKGPYNCNEHYDDWSNGWSLEKKTYCCANSGKGCEDTSPPHPDLFNCEAGFHHWQEGWSQPQKEWCCQKAGKGCEDSFDCSSGFEWTWPQEKSSWCCKNSNKGCPKYDCDAGLFNYQEGWAEEKKKWCCQYEQKGCGTDPYNCAAGYGDWQTGWTFEKKEWCCAREMKGCKKLFNCDKSFDTWQTSWSMEQKEFCCAHGGKGCAGLPYDCNAGWDNWKAGWAPDKKAWCCQHGGKACPPGFHNTSPETYDCNAAWDNFEVAWSTEKKAYCCRHAGRACKPYDCNENFHDWIHWTLDKKRWCCSNEDKACS